MIWFVIIGLFLLLFMCVVVRHPIVGSNTSSFWNTPAATVSGCRQVRGGILSKLAQGQLLATSKVTHRQILRGSPWTCGLFQYHTRHGNDTHTYSKEEWEVLLGWTCDITDFWTVPVCQGTDLSLGEVIIHVRIVGLPHPHMSRINICDT